MENYIVQKASQAFEDLCSEESLEERLKGAVSHLRMVAHEHFLKSLPPEAREYLEAVNNIPEDNPRPFTATTVRHAITAIFEAWGVYWKSQKR